MPTEAELWKRVALALAVSPDAYERDGPEWAMWCVTFYVKLAGERSHAPARDRELRFGLQSEVVARLTPGDRAAVRLLATELGLAAEVERYLPQTGTD